jgi:hypothetical protein
MKINTTLSAAYAYLRNSAINRKAIPTVTTLDCGAQIVVKLPRSNDKTHRLCVGFRKNNFSRCIHWVGTATAFASSEEATIHQLNYVVSEIHAFKSVTVGGAA